MKVDLICYFIKYIGINICLSICYYKITNYFSKLKSSKRIILFFAMILFGILQSIIVQYIPPFFVLIPAIFLYSVFFSKLFKNKLLDTFIVSIISLAISYITSLLPMVVGSILPICFKYLPYASYLSLSIMTILHIVLIILFFKIKRLKNGFSFLKNDYLKLLILLITTIAIFTYVITENLTDRYLIYILCIIAIISFIIIKQSFNIYQTQKNQLKTLKEYEQELTETKQKLQIAIQEKEKIVKSNHEFFHRQEALKNKLNLLVNSSFTSETAQEISAISDRINNLSNEYIQKTDVSTYIRPTGIVEIDDMISYMKNECNQNNIEFSFKLNCNINKIIGTYIEKSDLETLLGDLIRNAIIAINNSTNPNRSIMLVFGLVENFYEIDVYDTGIDFKIETLLNLGIKKCSTHLDAGGTGIGFITTFETMAKCKSSLIINELNNSNYSKIIGIRFDNLNTYTIISDRIDEINLRNSQNRKINLINNK